LGTVEVCDERTEDQVNDDGWIDTLPEQPDASSDALPWRRRLANWPDAWRERWGHRANALEASGVPWIEAERQAWNETYPERNRPETVTKAETKRESRTLFKESA
jgi:hypothetical protein